MGMWRQFVHYYRKKKMSTGKIRSSVPSYMQRHIGWLIKYWRLNESSLWLVVQLKYFRYLCFRGDTAIVELLLLNNATANSKDKKWLTPLHRACCSGNYNVVDILLRYKADVNARDRSWQTPLHVAAANNAVQCVELLMPHLLNINVTDRFVHTFDAIIAVISCWLPNGKSDL